MLGVRDAPPGAPTPPLGKPSENGIPIGLCDQSRAVGVLPLRLVARREGVALLAVRSVCLRPAATAVGGTSEVDRIVDDRPHRLFGPPGASRWRLDPLGVEQSRDLAEGHTGGLAEHALNDRASLGIDLQADRAALLVLDGSVAVRRRPQPHHEAAGELLALAERESKRDVLALILVDGGQHRRVQLAARAVVELVMDVLDGHAVPAEGALQHRHLADVASEARCRQGDYDIDVAVLGALQEIHQHRQVPVGAAADLAVDVLRLDGGADPAGERQALGNLAVEPVAVLSLPGGADPSVDRRPERGGRGRHRGFDCYCHVSSPRRLPLSWGPAGAGGLVRSGRHFSRLASLLYESSNGGGFDPPSRLRAAKTDTLKPPISQPAPDGFLRYLELGSDVGDRKHGLTH